MLQRDEVRSVGCRLQAEVSSLRAVVPFTGGHLGKTASSTAQGRRLCSTFRHQHFVDDLNHTIGLVHVIAACTVVFRARPPPRARGSRLAIKGVLIEVRVMVMILLGRIGQECLSVLDIRALGGTGCSTGKIL